MGLAKKNSQPESLRITEITSATGSSFSVDRTEALKKNWDALNRIAKPLVEKSQSKDKANVNKKASSKSAK